MAILRTLLRSAVLLAVGLSGCATTSLPKAPTTPHPVSSSGFPTREELVAVGHEPPPAPGVEVKMVDDPDWQLTGPLPDQAGAVPHTDPSLWFQTLAKRVDASSGELLPTEAMHCAAREAGLFFLARAALPTLELQTFIALRCGVSEPFVSTLYVDGTVPVKSTDDAVFQQWAPSLDKLLQAVGTGRRAVGVWFGEKNGHAVLLVTFAAIRAVIDPVSMRADEHGQVLIRGVLLQGATSAKALVIQGPWGVASCAADPSVALPRFAFACEPRPDTDGSARIDLETFQAGHILGDDVASVLTWPAGSPRSTFTRSRHLPETPVRDGPDFQQRFLGLLNGQRNAAGQGPLALATPESATLTQVAPHFFASIFSREPPAVRDRVALGTCAGWDVDSPVTRGDFASGYLTPSRDAGVLLSYMLSRPSTRSVLLTPDARQLAIGAWLEGGALGAILGMYVLQDPKEDASAKVLEALKAARGAKAGPITAPPEVQDVLPDAARSVKTGARTTDEALKSALAQTATRVTGRIRGWWMHVGALDQVKFPPELLGDGPATIAVFATPYRVEADPWSGYLVFLLAVEPEGFRTASSGDATRSNG